MYTAHYKFYVLANSILKYNAGFFHVLLLVGRQRRTIDGIRIFFHDPPLTFAGVQRAQRSVNG